MRSLTWWNKNQRTNSQTICLDLFEKDTPLDELV